MPAAVAVDGAGADRAVGHLADDDVVALLARLRLGQAEARDVRRAEGRARDVDVHERMGLEPGGSLDGDDPLVGRLVRERRAGREVADRVDPSREVRCAPSTATRPRSVSAMPAASSPSAATSGPRPAREHEPVDLDLLAADAEGDRVVGARDVLDRGRRCAP